MSQVLEPGIGARRHVVTPPREDKQRVKLSQQLLRVTAFFENPRPLCPLNPALNGIFIKTLEKLIWVGTKVERVKKISCGGHAAGLLRPPPQNLAGGANLEIFPFFLLQN